ncbi:MAG: general secretion pathway protein M [Parasphingorhabdus sp.]|jgi:general secretion pathway protein M
MNSFWSGLNPRERRIISWGLFITVGIVVYLFFLEPRYQRLNMLRAQVPSQGADLAWMRQQIEIHKATLNKRSANQVAEQMPLLTIVEKTATQSGLRASISRMQPAENNQVRVWFDDIYFDHWLRWIEILKQKKIQISAATVNKTKDQKVNIRVTLG